ADNLYGRSGTILLTKGTVLSSAYLKSILRLNFNGVYIHDDHSKDLEIRKIINEDLRIQAVQGIKTIFIAAEDKQKIGNQRTKELELLVASIIEEIMQNENVLINMVDIKVFDDYTYYHSVNVAVISIVLGVALELTRQELHDLCLGALLHDIGKVFIPKHILKKENQLDYEEIEEVRQHPVTGCEYLKKAFQLPSSVITAIMDHHEKYDGSGYPEGRKADRISLSGKIIAISDVYDALTSNRPYRKALLPSDAIELIMGSSGTHFEPKLVDTFLRKIAPYPIGTLVFLSNEYTGIVVENHERFCLRPTIRIIKKEQHECAPFLLELVHHDNASVTITKVL
ncbi:MAG: HD-GYP domain-containing protein, partial [Eubacteriales bacterium]|nr:HD-GYP domain-containing protein [Eubacteriales bacterium]